MPKIKEIKNCEILLDNMKISRTETAKFLGVVMDKNLSWKHHINYIEKKIAKSVGIIKRLRYCLTEHTLNTLYSTLVLPYLNDCNIIWANNKPTRLKPLLILQKRCMQARSHGGAFWVRAPPLKLSAPSLKIQK